MLWGFPGEMAAGGATTQTDLRVGVESALQAALDAGTPPRLSLRLTAGRPSQIRLAALQPRGTLIRRIATVPTLSIQGEAAPLPAEAPFPERPGQRHGGLHLRYLGIRVIPELSDAVPVGAVFGHVVGRGGDHAAPAAPGPARRAHRTDRADRRAPEATALLLTLRDAVTGAALGAPVKVALDPAREIATHWIELPQGAAVDAPLAVALRAASGRFLWKPRGDGDAAPRLRLAVHDPDPGGRPLQLAGATLLHVEAATLRQRGLALPPAGFADRCRCCRASCSSRWTSPT